MVSEVKKILILILLFFICSCSPQYIAEPVEEDIQEEVTVQEETQAPEQEEITEEPEVTVVDELKEDVDEVTEASPKIEGKTLGERLQILKDHLHDEGSGNEARKYFPDFEAVYVDKVHPPFPSEILPFTYYYSKEANITVNICNVAQTVFICPGKLERLISEDDYDRCQVTPVYISEGG